MLTQRPIREGWNRLRGALPLFEDTHQGQTPFRADSIIASHRDGVVRVIGTLGFEIRTQDDLESIRNWAMVTYPEGTKLHVAQSIVVRRALSALDESPKLVAEDWRTSGFWEFSLSQQIMKN